MKQSIEPVLGKIAKALNSSDILWGVGASLLLNQYGLGTDPGDIDIIVSVSDINKVDEIMSSLGQKQTVGTSDIYRTEYFFEYLVDGVHVDIMAGFKVNLSNSVFEYKFDKSSVPNKFWFGSVSVPFSTLEEWYVLYQVIPGKDYKADIIADYFYKNGIQYPSLLKKMADNPTLPSNIKENISRLV